MPTDPRALRGDAPLLDAWLRFHEDAPTPFTIPGHKQRCDLVGDVIAGDVPLYAGLDTVKLRGGLLAEAEARAAAHWSAELCRFSVGGATHGNQALALAVAGPSGGRVVVGRTLHRSAFLGLVLAGLTPVWVRPDIDATTGLPLRIPAQAVDAALRANPDARAVMVGDPFYVGTIGDVGALADVAHAHGIPLVVDAAWAAHFGGHPGLPPHAMSLGADAMVVSAHKSLPAWSQAALVLARSRTPLRPTGFDAGRLDSAVEATATTSPSGAILASIDASRALLARDGAELFGVALAAMATARERLQAVPGLLVLDGPHVDPLALTLVLPGTGADGNAIEADLIAAGLPIEMADQDTICAQVTLADTPQSLGRLTDALVAAIAARRGRARAVVPATAYAVDPVVGMAPREAFLGAHATVPAASAVGRISAELIAPYPPGIPVLAPGEVVTAEVLDALTSARDRGTRIAYAADPTLETLRVVDAT